MDTYDVQQQVIANIAARGYREGWTAEQFAARQVCKLVEELGELAEAFEIGHAWQSRLWATADEARRAFDDAECWGGVGAITDIDKAKFELSDIQVVVDAMAGVFAEITGEPFDVALAAVKKSEADVKRGKRNG